MKFPILTYENAEKYKLKDRPFARWLTKFPDGMELTDDNWRVFMDEIIDEYWVELSLDNDALIEYKKAEKPLSDTYHKKTRIVETEYQDANSEALLRYFRESLSRENTNK